MQVRAKKPFGILRSSIFRLALLYMALSIGSVVVLLGFIYWATAGYADRQIDATIEAEIKGLAEQYRRRGLVGLRNVIAERVSRDPGGASVYLLADEDLEPLVGNLSRWPEPAASDAGWVSFRLRDWGHDKSEEHQARARTFVLRSGLNLLVGRDVRDLEATRARILNALGWGLAITAALALGAGLAMGSRVMRRIDAINQTSRDIIEGDLSRRVPTDGNGDDFDELADNLNRMLERIELSAETHAGQPEISVADSGPGIPREMREKVFQRFFRLDDSRSTPGSGLGLSLVRAVAELHGAGIRMEANEPGLRVELRFGRSGESTLIPSGAA